jgi:hypothetical protein
MTLAEKTLQVAINQLGVSEKPVGSNAGPEVNNYLKSVGLRPGYAWCMAFIYWCVEQAAKELNEINPLVKTGGVLRQWNEVKLRKLSSRDRAIKPGDIFIMDYGKGLGHAGFVERVGNGIIHTIEGNTNEGGSREGYKVTRRQRLLTTINKGFIQL